MSPFSKMSPCESRLVSMFGLNGNNIYANFLQPQIKIPPASFAKVGFNDHGGFEHASRRN